MKNTIKVERAKRDMTQEDLARLVGVTRQTINSIEKNRYAPSITLVLKISRLFDTPVNELFELDESD